VTNDLPILEGKFSVNLVVNACPGSGERIFRFPITGTSGLGSLNVSVSEGEVLGGDGQHVPHRFGFVAPQVGKYRVREYYVIMVACLHSGAVSLLERTVEFFNDFVVCQAFFQVS